MAKLFEPWSTRPQPVPYFSIVFEFWLYALATHFHSPSIFSSRRTSEGYPVVPPKTEYALTDLGTATVPIVHAMDKGGADFFTQLGVPIPCDEE